MEIFLFYPRQQNLEIIIKNKRKAAVCLDICTVLIMHDLHIMHNNMIFNKLHNFVDNFFEIEMVALNLLENVEEEKREWNRFFIKLSGWWVGATNIQQV